MRTLVANGFVNACRVDVRNIDYSTYPEVEVLAGGPPCQPFSQSHDGDGRYDPRDMIPEFIRAVAALLPRLFVMEEVQTLTWSRHRDYLERVEDDLRALGYVVQHRVVNAADHGFAQARKRLFVVGVRVDVVEETGTDQPDFLAIWPEARPTVTMAAALGWDEDTCAMRNHDVPDPRAWVDMGDHPLGFWPMHRPAPTVVGSFRPEVAAAPGYRRKGDPPRQATPGSVVTTLRERLILQDMPVDWTVCGNDSAQALQVGNSVPCGLIREIIDLNYFPEPTHITIPTLEV